MIELQVDAFDEIMGSGYDDVIRNERDLVILRRREQSADGRIGRAEAADQASCSAIISPEIPPNAESSNPAPY